MLFCCLWRSVETSCHKHFVIVFCRQQAQCHNLRTVVRRCRIGNTWPVAALKACNEAIYRLRSRFMSIPPAFDAPIRGFRSEYCHAVWYGKTRMVWHSTVKKFWRYVYSLRENVRTWQTDGRSGAVSYSPSIVTMALSCLISEIKRILVENSDFFISLAFDAPVRGFRSQYCHPVWYGNLEWRSYLMV